MTQPSQKEDGECMKSIWSKSQQIALLTFLLLIIEIPISINSNPVQTVNQKTSVIEPIIPTTQ